jgi:nitronate monooxygenase
MARADRDGRTTMFDVRDATTAIVQAPMAGGATTPALAAAVTEARGLGFLASGYQTPAALSADIAAVKAATTGPFGVNLFVPERIRVPDGALGRYREQLLPLARRLGAALPEHVEFTDDWYGQKLEIVLDERIPVVSFTFGCPDVETVRRLRTNGSYVIATVTNADEAALAEASAVDAICVQGVSAGGHRAMFHIADSDPALDTFELLRQVRARSSLPIIAAGGVSGGDDVRRLLDSGAAAVQVGTLFLRAAEAGTRPAHLDALTDPDFASTVLTRAYSGRWARGLANNFTRRYSGIAPAIYPQVNTLTSVLRTAAANDPQVINLWAGTGFRNARALPASAIVDHLAG